MMTDALRIIGREDEGSHGNAQRARFRGFSDVRNIQNLKLSLSDFLGKLSFGKKKLR